MHPHDGRLRELLKSFPLSLCDESACRRHIASAAFRHAPNLTSACGEELGAMASDAAKEEDLALTLKWLFDEAEVRAGSASATGPAARVVRSSLFVVFVMLLHAALMHAPPSVAARHAEGALRCLHRLAAGAVQLPELDELTQRLLPALSPGRLAPLLEELLETSRLSAAALALRARAVVGALLEVARGLLGEEAAVAGGGEGREGEEAAATSAVATAACSLAFELLPLVADPLLPELQHGALALALAAPQPWQRERCLSQLRDAVCSSHNHARKPGLVRWMLEARERVVGACARLVGARATAASGVIPSFDRCLLKAKNSSSASL
ncbi:hypothetical protein EMIHUDRAFT_209035 [Emiliania huxleyi CCMP1516]|uniref:MMS19 nucleotide excision repair protein n=2 Tax=Emiliania huxleyi TaxID=2903 RepID=A0A0D3J7J6_EMIH1|nr:hypothetical protein EMIHUDRAFT_209035 [Emiliania huxleyi CCMP1516]EOD19481.1 hypothetical protein EMIHUDRAFT_209035 [Emiliania huxleyi CCMP1516]|eukprot:XP_005771910.1 hypothetical protein EMIHUDRAFT_209035 [Emiliania huxleyi CCMP1516]